MNKILVLGLLTGILCIHMGSVYVAKTKSGGTWTQYVEDGEDGIKYVDSKADIPPGALTENKLTPEQKAKLTAARKEIMPKRKLTYGDRGTKYMWWFIIAGGLAILLGVFRGFLMKWYDDFTNDSGPPT